MLLEINIIPLGGGTHLSDAIADVIKIIDQSGLPYQLTPCGTCIEGGWDELMSLARKCHEHTRERSQHVITMIQLEDQEGVKDKLRHNILSVEAKVGKKPERLPS
jgi:uncharacterized protein (TIGR00106 family)